MDEKEKMINNEEIPLIKDISAVGYNINSVYDFVNTTESYPNAIPVLINHLSKNYRKRVLEGIVRALAVKEAKGVANAELFKLYSRTPKEDNLFRWAIANTLSFLMTNDDVEEVIKIVSDSSNGTSRQMLVLALGKQKSERVKNVLLSLASDKDVKLHVEGSLKKMK